jgi:hypothetical protein
MKTFQVQFRYQVEMKERWNRRSMWMRRAFLGPLLTRHVS